MDSEKVLWKSLTKDYVEISINDLNTFQGKDPIPLGSINFTQEVLKLFYGIDKMNPIEIPPILRTDEFLKRGYKIVPFKDIPNGRYFIKDVSQLKSFSGIIDTSDLSELNKNHLFQVSEILNIKAEYRVYIINGQIYAIAYYNGEPWIFPDVSIINKANCLYSLQKDYPKSYTMDVAVTDKGTCILECHVLLACGIYTTIVGKNFLNGYYHAMEYLKKYNTELRGDICV